MKELTWNELKSGLWKNSFLNLKKECHSEYKAPGITCLFCSQLLHQANFLSVLEMCLFELPFLQSPQTPHGISEFWNRLNFERHSKSTCYGAKTFRSTDFLGPDNWSINPRPFGPLTMKQGKMMLAYCFTWIGYCPDKIPKEMVKTVLFLS